MIRDQLDLFNEKEEVAFQQDFELGVKLCTHCKKELPLKAFPLWSATAFGGEMRRSSCRECYSKHTKIIKDLYRTAPPKTEQCECCGITVKRLSERKKYSNSGMLQLDHEHETGEFRGWICFQCNQGIGKLGDNLEGVVKAVWYLAKKNLNLILKTIDKIKK
tara:strand:+ start:302 stop:787 length:486 start_codon:yes stop_codon:yes gene_type:complete